ncbi:MAG TPA: hypothetical protein VH325_09965 [Bryobacteraceae bacterium]|nr:hypothetical protein [Bryobacteraceae bacterium]
MCLARSWSGNWQRDGQGQRGGQEQGDASARSRNGGQGQSGQGPRPGFQNAQIRSADNSDHALTQAAADASAPDLSADADPALLVNGSTSGGLAQASDDESRRQRMMNGPAGGGPGGEGFGGVGSSLAIVEGWCGGGGRFVRIDSPKTTL